jgi:hypothetical protein
VLVEPAVPEPALLSPRQSRPTVCGQASRMEARGRSAHW